MRTNVSFDSAGIPLAGHLYIPDDGPGTSTAGARGRPPWQRRQGAGLRPLRPAPGRRRGSSRSPTTRPTRVRAAANPAAWRTQPTASRTSRPPSRSSPRAAKSIPSASARSASAPPAAMRSPRPRATTASRLSARSALTTSPDSSATAGTGATTRPSSRACWTSPPPPAAPRPRRGPGRCGCSPTRSSRPASSAESTAPKALSTTAPPARASTLNEGNGVGEHRQDGHLRCVRAVPLIGPRPLLMVVGTRAVTSWMSIDAFQTRDRAQGAVLDRRRQPQRPLRQAAIRGPRGRKARELLHRGPALRTRRGGGRRRVTTRPRPQLPERQTTRDPQDEPRAPCGRRRVGHSFSRRSVSTISTIAGTVRGAPSRAAARRLAIPS